VTITPDVAREWLVLVLAAWKKAVARYLPRRIEKELDKLRRKYSRRTRTG
jgi:hypothetical protein